MWFDHAALIAANPALDEIDTFDARELSTASAMAHC
jgi:hypothetical protein